jgi:hypothetical protein
MLCLLCNNVIDTICGKSQSLLSLMWVNGP